MEHIFFNYSDIIEEIADRYELKNLSEKTKGLRENMECFKLRFLFVGAFSAGKSALINAILKRELLTEDQRPETAIASELVYDTDEYIEAVNDQGSIRCSIEQADEIDVDNYDHLVWHIDNDFLKRHKDRILVDMPGFNSGLKKHNNAILKYAGSGNAYVLVVDCEDGAIKRSIGEFIKEIKNYDNNIVVVVTKTDLKMAEDVEKIKSSVAMSAANLLGRNVAVIDTNKYDEEASKKAEELLSSIDASSVFSQEYYSEIYNIAVSCLSAVEVYRKSIDLDLEEYDRVIEAHYNAGKELSEKLQKEKKALEERFRGVAQAVLCDVQNALYNNEDALVSSLKAGGKNFSVTVNNILRPVLYSSTRSYSESAFGKFLSEFESYYSSSVENCVSPENVYATVEHLKETGNKITALSGDAEKANALYKTVITGLSVLTDTVAPWLELILIFLPDIIELVGKLIQSSELKNKVKSEVIPQIVERLRPEIENSVQNIKDQMLEETVAQIRDMINNEAEALEQAKKTKKVRAEDINSRLCDVDKDIERMTEIVNSLA